jgi:dolichol-phosphate mannosyltransferase
VLTEATVATPHVVPRADDAAPPVRARTADRAGIALSVVIPVHDEEANIGPLVAETLASLAPLGAFEIVCVDDRSTDRTLAVLRALAIDVSPLRVLAHPKRRGQSAAIRTGVKAARGAWIATMDGDGQNDPRDIPRLIAQRETSRPEVKLFAGWRVDRKDSGSKRWASRWANRIRSAALRDRTPDTGCGIKLFEREAFLDLPYFDHMHRYLPALMQRAGWATVSVPVSHRPRLAGRSKYGNLSRAVAGLWDLLGVAWLMRRSSVGDAREVTKEHDHDE